MIYEVDVGKSAKSLMNLQNEQDQLDLTLLGSTDYHSSCCNLSITLLT